MLIVILLLVALILFVLAAIPRVSHGSFVPAGLACVVASMLVPLL
ncbi:MAG: hypothetical protein V4696_10135 [Pseudomonadota bacterium]